MVGQAAEQIIAGVVLSERLAVTMYGAIHRAQFSGLRNLRGLVVDPRMLAEASFRGALTDAGAIATAVALDHPNIVPTVTVESGGPDVVVVTRGVGRYVTVQDLITAARANRAQGGKLPIPVAAAIGRSVIEALAAAHRAKVVHGAVHPRSVLLDEDGGVRLGDFVVGRALTTAVAQGADAVLWRGLAGYLAPELVVGEDPTPAADVFAVGAMLFTMLSGEVPPGSLHVTPAVERLVQRALDTDLARRYRSASDLLENLLEAFEDDRWDIADRGEVIKAAGLSQTDDNVDEATEDLLASLGSKPAPVQVTPLRPTLELRASATAAQGPGGARLDALLADLDDRENTAVEDRPFARDPISEVIQHNPRRSEAIVQVRPRVPSLDDPDDETPLPPPFPDDDSNREVPRGRGRGMTGDEAAAMDALSDLDDNAGASHDPDSSLAPTSAYPRNGNGAGRSRGRVTPAPVVRPRAEPAVLGTPRPEPVARARISTPVAVPTEPAPRAARAATPLPVEPTRSARAATPLPLAPVEPDEPELPARPARAVTPVPDVPSAPPIARSAIVDVPQIDELPPVRLKSRALGIISLIAVVGGAVGFYFVYQSQKAERAERAARSEAARKDAEEQTRALQNAQADPGTINVATSPSEASVWVKLGRTNVDSMPLSSNQLHRLRIELDGYQPVDTEVVAASWEGQGETKRAKVTVTLKAAALDPKTKRAQVTPLPALPPNLAPQTGFSPGEGPVRIETSPPGAEVWLLIGYGNTGARFPTIAGRAYELRALADGYKPGFQAFTAEDWRAPNTDTRLPIDLAKKRATLDARIELVPDPSASKPTSKPGK